MRRSALCDADPASSTMVRCKSSCSIRPTARYRAVRDGRRVVTTSLTQCWNYNSANLPPIKSQNVGRPRTRTGRKPKKRPQTRRHTHQKVVTNDDALRLRGGSAASVHKAPGHPYPALRRPAPLPRPRTARKRTRTHLSGPARAPRAAACCCRPQTAQSRGPTSLRDHVTPHTTHHTRTHTHAHTHTHTHTHSTRKQRRP